MIEHKVIFLSFFELEEALNRLAAEDWRVVSVVPANFVPGNSQALVTLVRPRIAGPRETKEHTDGR